MAGSSARREHERRVAKREQRIRSKHPRLGGLILALSDEPQSTKAWATGAVGEERLGRRLDATAGPLVRVLHDRGIRRSRANLDHLVVCANGVFVVDAKRYQGRPHHVIVEGGFFTPRVDKLLVGRRDCTKLVDAGLKQADLVRGALADDTVEVRSVLCFVEADWPLLGGDFVIRGVMVTWPKKLAATIARPGPLTEEQITDAQQRLATAFPSGLARAARSTAPGVEPDPRHTPNRRHLACSSSISPLAAARHTGVPSCPPSDRGPGP